MVQYDRRILNKLLDSYEGSLLFTGEYKVNISISYAFNKKNIAEYYDESSLVYEDIHAAMKVLERKCYLRIIWKKENHIILKVILNLEKLAEIYQYLGRTSKLDNIYKTLKLLDNLKRETTAKTVINFINYLMDRIRKGQTVKEFIELSDIEKTRQLIKAVEAVLNNQQSFYIREFSIQHFHDSKLFEKKIQLVEKVMKQFHEGMKEMDIYAILAEYKIYHTPDYVYVKGTSGILRSGRCEIVLNELHQGVGICGEDLEYFHLDDTKQINKIITIENLTTFFRWREEASLIIYLGGYHNASRRQFLHLIYDRLPDAAYYHFGDIDMGGFEIYEDLKRRTGIPFQSYLMDLNTLRKYEKYGKKLTSGDQKRIQDILNKDPKSAYADVLEYMQEHKIKLEQECIKQHSYNY